MSTHQISGGQVMSTHQSIEQDERTVAVIATSCQWAFFFFCLALPIDYAYRAIVRHENAWDLMALVIVGGAVCAIYQARQKALPHGWVKTGMLIALLGAVIGIIVVLAMLAIICWVWKPDHLIIPYPQY